MEKIIVYVDDGVHALQQLASMKSGAQGNAGATRTHWVLVACAPRMTQRVSKWVSHSARENWRAKWSEKLFAAVTPQLRTDGDEVTMELAKGPLCDLSRQLVGKHGACRILDARRPKFGHPMEPVTEDQRAATGAKWEVPGAVAGLGAMLVLAAE